MVTDPISVRLLRGQLRWMGDAGYEVHLACSPGPDLEAFGDAEEVTVHHLPLVRDPAPLRDLWALVNTVILLRRLRPALVNASTPKAGLIATAAAWLCRVPVRVYVVRGLRFEGQVGASRRALRALERVTIRLATSVVFNSRSLQALAVHEGLCPAGAGVVLGGGSGNGVDLDRFADLPSPADARRQLGLDTDALVIGFVGRLTRDKGVVDVVTAFDWLAASRPDLYLLLVGDHEPGDPVPDEVRRHIEAHQRILTTGWVADPAPLYAAMDVLAFPSYREGLPNVPLEAQAAGLPVVAYAATGTVDAVRPGETGVLVAVGDVEALRAAVGELLDHPEHRRSLGSRARGWVAQTFVPRHIWGELESHYQRWLGPSER